MKDQHPEAYELRMPTYGCTTCGAVHQFPFAARFCDHRDPKPENILPDPRLATTSARNSTNE